MKSKLVKVLAIGAVLSLALGMTATAAYDIFDMKPTIFSTKYNDYKVSLNGEPLNFSRPLISVVRGEPNNYADTYMPVRSVFEAMGYIVDWQQEEQTIDIRPKYMLVEQDGLVIRNEKIEMGTHQFNVDLMENLATGSKWECTIPEDNGVSLLADTYSQDGSTDAATLHRFTIRIDRSAPESGETPAVIFTQTIDGKPTGYSVQYFIWAAQAGSVW